jgi:hypothetical protein
MSGLLFLTSSDFNIQRGSRGDIMCHNIRGFSLIMFYSTHCGYCQTLLPIFKKLPGTIEGCQFGMVNVSTNKECVQLARATIAPIEYVPFIILYINGKPFMQYPKNSPYTMESIHKFVIEIANNIKQKQQFAPEKVKDTGVGIPEYCIGKPIIGNEKVCYLEYMSAYKKNS